MKTKHTYGFEDDEVLTLGGLVIGHLHADLEVKDEIIRRLNAHDALVSACKHAAGVIYAIRTGNVPQELIPHIDSERLIRAALAQAGQGEGV